MKASTVYTVECWSHRHANGKRRKVPKLRWRDLFNNIVAVTAGLNKLLDANLQERPDLADVVRRPQEVPAGSGRRRLALASHSGWAEIAPYSNGTRPAFTPGSISAGAVDNSASEGCVQHQYVVHNLWLLLLVDNNTVSGTTGTCTVAGGGSSSRSIINGDTLNITVTLTQTTA